jgi:hypothetical protein
MAWRFSVARARHDIAPWILTSADATSPARHERARRASTTSPTLQAPLRSGSTIDPLGDPPLTPCAQRRHHGPTNQSEQARGQLGAVLASAPSRRSLKAPHSTACHFRTRISFVSSSVTTSAGHGRHSTRAVISYGSPTSSNARRSIEPIGAWNVAWPQR